MSLLASALVAHMPVALLGFNLEDILISTGPWVLVVSAIIVFIESGVLFPVLPGDSLIFALGMLHDRMGLSLWLAFPVLIVAAVAGGEGVCAGGVCAWGPTHVRSIPAVQPPGGKTRAEDDFADEDEDFLS